MINLAFWRVPAQQTGPLTPPTAPPATLSQARAGNLVKVVSFGKLKETQRQHLQAYGLMPGRTVQVLAQQPVTIILIEQTELAFEKEIARQIVIE